MLHDIWYAFRRLSARPWHTALIVGILAVGSGATLTVFRVADAILLRALPYRDANRLVRISMNMPMVPNSELPFSDVGYRALEKRTHSMEMLASYRTVGVNITIGSNPQRVLSARVTGNFFDLLGLPAQRGRLFSAGQETEKGPPVIVLSDALWRGSFGAKPDVAGTIVRVDGIPATVIGVADARVAFPAADVGYFTLMDLDAVGTAPFELGIDVVGRLRTGVALQTLVNDATHVIQQVAHENPGPHSSPDSDVSGFRAVVYPLRDDIAGGVKPTLVLLTCAVGFVLLLTCVNVATLELVRSSARRAELAIRAALGANRSRLILGAMLEGTLQAASGVMLGFALSAVTVQGLHSLLPNAFGKSASSEISIEIVVAACTMTILGAIASGVFPIMITLSSDLQSALRDRAAAATRRLTWLRKGLIVLQIAFACVLVHGATLMIMTVREMQRVSLGFRTEGLLTFQISLPRETYSKATDVNTTFSAIETRLSSMPGVVQAALANRVPLTADYSNTMLAVEGRPFKADGTDPNVDFRIVSAGYFAAMGIRVAAGRTFREGDTYLDGTPVVLSKSLARLLWPNGGDPLEHRLRTGPFTPWMTIVGVVDDAKNRSVTSVARPEMYLPLGAPRSPMGVTRDVSVVLRTRSAQDNVQVAAQKLIREMNSDLPLFGMRRYEDIVQQSEQREIITMRTLTSFAAVALVLAIAGTYAMLMFVVVQRKRELALRLAIGATRVNLMQMIAREVSALLLAGIGTGMVSAFVMTRLLSGFLFGISALNAVAVATTLVIVSLAGIGAALIPARRASRVDIMTLLRLE